MPSSVYTKLINTISPYVDKSKAEEVVGRQLPNAGQTADSLSVDGLKKIVTSVSGAIALYVSDKVQREALVAAIKGLAA